MYSNLTPFKTIALAERPQERLDKLGASALSDTELLAMILRNGNKAMDVLQLSSCLISEAGSLQNLLKWTKEDFLKFNGIGKVKSLQLSAIMEISRRTILANVDQQTEFDNPGKVRDYFLPIARGLDVEKFWILCLNRKNKLIRHFEITSGTATSSLVHPREIFKEAIKVSATAIIGVHNHPSGNCQPSKADHTVTKQIKAASDIIDIDFLDHIIISSIPCKESPNNYFSFHENSFI